MHCYAWSINYEIESEAWAVARQAEVCLLRDAGAIWVCVRCVFSQQLKVSNMLDSLIVAGAL